MKYVKLEERESVLELKRFINQYVTRREESMFHDDVCIHSDTLIASIEGNSILIIGGAGSIGSSFIRAILPFHPSELIIVDTNENALTELTRSFRSSGEYADLLPKVYLPYPMDYNSEIFKRMFRNHRRRDGSHGFDIVANFSAHKHVRSEKDIYSVEALLRNNVINAKGLLDLLESNPPSNYFCVSTDKAANPVNIMGASKRIMEDLIFSYSDSFRVSTARFANVAFSNGSLLDGFLKRLALHQPISAPSDVKRYFVSPQESGQICMLAAMLGANREIFFPKLEEAQMMTFDAIARELLNACGYEPYECKKEEEAMKFAESANWCDDKLYPVYFSNSDTDGEKAFEEFYVDGEDVDLERFKALGVVKDKIIPRRSAVADLLNTLDEAFHSDNCSKADVVRILGDYLPNFKHIETGRSLDSKM